MKKKSFLVAGLIFCFSLTFISSCDKNMQLPIFSPHLLEVGTFNARIIMAPYKNWQEEASYLASIEHENIEQITYIRTLLADPIILPESRLRSIYLDYRNGPDVLLNHRYIHFRLSERSSHLEKIAQEAKEFIIDYALNQSYQPVIVFFMNARYDRDLKEVNLTMTALINMEESFLQDASLVPLLVLDKMPSDLEIVYTHKNVAVKSLSLKNENHEFDGSGYALAELLQSGKIARGDTFELVFSVQIPENSLENPQWKAYFIIENHQEKTKYGVFKIAIEE